MNLFDNKEIYIVDVNCRHTKMSIPFCNQQINDIRSMSIVHANIMYTHAYITTP